MKNDSLRPKALVAGAEKLNQNGGVGTGSAGCSAVASRALRIHVTSRILIGWIYCLKENQENVWKIYKTVDKKGQCRSWWHIIWVFTLIRQGMGRPRNALVQETETRRPETWPWSLLHGQMLSWLPVNSRCNGLSLWVTRGTRTVQFLQDNSVFVVQNLILALS